MRIFKILLLSTFVVFLGSCEMLNQLLPDLETEFEKVFTINVTSTQGSTSFELIDLSTIEEYEDYQDNISGFNVTGIGFEIENYDGPEDMNLTCELIARSTDGETDVKVGDINSVNIYTIADNGVEYDAVELTSGLDQVVAWLDNPGSFYVSTSYVVTDMMGEAYPVSAQGYSFDLRVRYYVSVLTQLK